MKSKVFKDMYEVRDSAGWLLGIGTTKEEAEKDASYYDGRLVELWESPNMINKLATWELI